MPPLNSDATANRLELEGVAAPAEYLNDTIRTMTGHESVRKFLPTPVPMAMMDVIMAAARSAPTSSNLQAFSVIMVDDVQRKARLASLAGEQRFIEEAPWFLVFCADLSRLRYLSERQGRVFGGDTLEMFLLASVDAALVMQNTLVAAESLGLATTPVGAVRDHPDLIAEELGLPEGVYAVAGLSIGYERPGARRGTKPRLRQDATVHRNQYNTDTREEVVADYDRTMLARGTYFGRQIRVPGEDPMPDAEYGWAEHTALRCSAPESIGAPSTVGRRDLREQLERRGFSFN